MNKISEKVQSTKLNETAYTSLNGNMLKKIRGGAGGSGTTDRLCKGSCGATAAFDK